MPKKAVVNKKKPVASRKKGGATVRRRRMRGGVFGDDDKAFLLTLLPNNAMTPEFTSRKAAIFAKSPLDYIQLWDTKTILDSDAQKYDIDRKGIEDINYGFSKAGEVLKCPEYIKNREQIKPYFQKAFYDVKGPNWSNNIDDDKLGAKLKVLGKFYPDFFVDKKAYSSSGLVDDKFIDFDQKCTAFIDGSLTIKPAKSLQNSRLFYDYMVSNIGPKTTSFSRNESRDFQMFDYMQTSSLTGVTTGSKFKSNSASADDTKDPFLKALNDTNLMKQLKTDFINERFDACFGKKKDTSEKDNQALINYFASKWTDADTTTTMKARFDKRSKYFVFSNGVQQIFTADSAGMSLWVSQLLPFKQTGEINLEKVATYPPSDIVKLLMPDLMFEKVLAFFKSMPNSTSVSDDWVRIPYNDSDQYDINTILSATIKDKVYKEVIKQDVVEAMWPLNFKVIPTATYKENFVSYYLLDYNINDLVLGEYAEIKPILIPNANPNNFQFNLRSTLPDGLHLGNTTTNNGLIYGKATTSTDTMRVTIALTYKGKPVDSTSFNISVNKKNSLAPDPDCLENIDPSLKSWLNDLLTQVNDTFYKDISDSGGTPLKPIDIELPTNINKDILKRAIDILSDTVSTSSSREGEGGFKIRKSIRGGFNVTANGRRAHFKFV